ncbi:MAG: UDP-glucose/GDP-mannose dehydrogenase family protein [Candidatus Omnitrophica bacterium]|nr:UDP-glucose/GDP-mannose dehydrogenase family protein [Candidatus Omnitrophota bacterium]
MKRIAVIGAGHVGLVTAACFAKLGNKVICVDNDQKKIIGLKKGVIPFFEPGLEELVKKVVKKKTLSFSFSIAESTENSEIIFIAVGTPSKEDGGADLSAVEAVTSEIAKAMKGYKLLVEKSTVPVMTGEWVKRTINLIKKKEVRHESWRIDFDVAANPEFLREGSAILDFLEPERIIIGTESERAKRLLKELYQPIKAPIIFTDVRSAELIKHASNSFLATKISYINAISSICEKVGADVSQVAKGMGYDSRIGKKFLSAGVGYGGSCFSKDVAAFIHLAKEAGYDFNLLKAVQRINQEQLNLVFKKIKKFLCPRLDRGLKNKTIGILGLSFKPDTDDIREAPSIKIIEKLLSEGAILQVYDPKAMREIKKIFPDLTYCENPYEVCKGSELLLILTEWEEFKRLDLKRVKKLLQKPYLIDGRNIYEPERMKKLGFIYEGIGRK